jgi:putative N6-adenine-specific DNA methylase
MMPIVETAVALCAVGAEKTVSNELRKLKFSVLESAFGQVKFKADVEGLYRSLMGLRAADRVLLETACFTASDFDGLFEGVRNAPWEKYIPHGLGLKVSKVRTNRSVLKSQNSVQAITHKAAAERLCAKRRINRLPESSDEAELRIYIEKDRVSVLLDLSGEPLFKRGYRNRGGTAPLRETTAAAIILHSMWRRKFPLYDPFCGAGTIAVEAAMYAWDIAPGIGRHFTIEKLLIADKNAERKIRGEFLEKVNFKRLVRIAGSDSDASVIAAARANIENALAINKGRPDSLPMFMVLPMEEAKPVIFPGEKAEEGFIITNPPYGRRLGDTESSERVYAEMGKLSGNFSGWKLALITDHPGFESFFGRKADSCREITNGAIRSYLYQYERL